MLGKPPNRLSGSADWSKLDDDSLVQSLDSWEEHVPLEAAKECLERIGSLGPRFDALCREPENWKRLECGWWSVLHAWLVLAESGRDKHAPALFEGARHFMQSGRWFLAREQLVDDPLAQWAASKLEWFLHRIVRHRHHVEESAEVDFWEAVERFLRFMASSRNVQTVRAEKWWQVVEHVRRRTGERAGF